MENSPWTGSSTVYSKAQAFTNKVDSKITSLVNKGEISSDSVKILNEISAKTKDRSNLAEQKNEEMQSSSTDDWDKDCLTLACIEKPINKGEMFRSLQKIREVLGGDRVELSSVQEELNQLLKQGKILDSEADNAGDSLIKQLLALEQLTKSVTEPEDVLCRPLKKKPQTLMIWLILVQKCLATWTPRIKNLGY